MCDVSRPPPSSALRFLPAMGLVQGLAFVAAQWRQVEQLRETRLTKDLELRHERSMNRQKLQAFERGLSALVQFEQSRANTFMAAMSAVVALREGPSAQSALEMAREILDRPAPFAMSGFQGGSR